MILAAFDIQFRFRSMEWTIAVVAPLLLSLREGETPTN